MVAGIFFGIVWEHVELARLPALSLSFIENE